MLVEELDKNIAKKREEISRWVEFHCEKVMVPLYSSVDLRFSEHKIAPIDTNVFPAGFNNLSVEFRKNAGKLFREYLLSRYPSARKILLVPELNTKNAYYWENVWVIKSILEVEDYEVRVGIANEEFRRAAGRAGANCEGSLDIFPKNRCLSSRYRARSRLS